MNRWNRNPKFYKCYNGAQDKNFGGRGTDRGKGYIDLI